MARGYFDFEGVFDDDYLHFYAERLSDERSDADAELIVALADITAGTDVLDVPCGHGRIANRLAARDADVVGIDLNERFVELACWDAAAAGVEVDYRVGDMRRLDADGGFDVVVNWFTSFGYFDDATDREVLSRFRRALRPGGRLVLETMNRDRIVAMRAAIGVPEMFHAVEVGDDMVVDRIEWDPLTSRTHTARTLVRDGAVRRTYFSVRLFTVTELADWLHDAGFSSVEAFGGSGVPFTWRSDRLLVVADA